MEFNYENNTKKNPIKIIIASIIILLTLSTICAIMIFSKTSINLKSNSFENLAIEYIKNKYNIDSTVYDIENSFAFDMEETKNKEKIIHLETSDDRLIDVLISKNNEEVSYADNYEENKIKKDIEEYFVQKFGTDINVFVNVGSRPLEGENMIYQKYNKDTFTTLNNSESPESIVIFLQLVDPNVDIQQLSKSDFPEIFPDNLKNINRKIIIGKLDNKDYLNIISPYDIGLYYEDDVEFEIIIPQYAVYLKEIRFLSTEKDFYKKFEITKNDKFYFLTPDTIELVSYDEDAVIENLPEIEEKYSFIKQLSGKYTFKLKEPYLSYIAIHKNELPTIDAIEMLNINAYMKENDKYIKNYGYIVGDYIVFNLIPYKDSLTEFYLIKTNFD